MANPHRGHVSLKAGDKEFRISYGINSLCELEEIFGKSIQKIIDEDISHGKDIRMSAVRKIIWAGLIDQDPDMTLKGAGDIADVAGIPACMAAIGQAFKLSFPEAKGSRNPRKPRE